jgi:hypothetical protein
MVSVTRFVECSEIAAGALEQAFEQKSSMLEMIQTPTSFEGNS